MHCRAMLFPTLAGCSVPTANSRVPICVRHWGDEKRRALVKSVLGVGTGGVCPFPQWGSEGITRKISKIYVQHRALSCKIVLFLLIKVATDFLPRAINFVVGKFDQP